MDKSAVESLRADARRTPFCSLPKAIFEEIMSFVGRGNELVLALSCHSLHAHVKEYLPRNVAFYHSGERAWVLQPCSLAFMNAAARGGHVEKVESLRTMMDPPCPWDETTVAEAVEQEHLHVLQWLRAQEPPCPWATNHYQGVLPGREGLCSPVENYCARAILLRCYIAAQKHKEAMALLTDNEGVDVGCGSVDGPDPLVAAAQWGCTEVVELVLSRGGALRVGLETKYSGRTALYWSCALNKVGAAQVLVGAGAMLDTTDRAGGTPLMSAAEAGHGEVVRLLLNSGAHVDACTDIRTTALMLACQFGHEESARCLMAHGASLSCRDKWGRTALMHAHRRGMEALATDMERLAASSHSFQAFT